MRLRGGPYSWRVRPQRTRSPRSPSAAQGPGHGGCGDRDSRRLSGMAATDSADEISELSSKLDSIEAVVDPEAMRTEAADLREQSADPGLWEDQTRAQQVTRRLSYLEGELARMESLRQRLADTQIMFELAEEMHEQAARDEAIADLAAVRKDIDALEVRTLLTGEYDIREA